MLIYIGELLILLVGPYYLSYTYTNMNFFKCVVGPALIYLLHYVCILISFVYYWWYLVIENRRLSNISNGYYNPFYVIGYIVEETLIPLFDLLIKIIKSGINAIVEIIKVIFNSGIYVI